MRKKHAIIIIVILVVIILFAGAIRIYTLPVSWDASACAGGYATYIFDKYNESLVQKYYDASDMKDGIISIEAVRGTQEVEWEGKSIYLYFDIEYTHNVEGTVVERVLFIGHRMWIDTYKWGGATIV